MTETAPMNVLPTVEFANVFRLRGPLNPCPIWSIICYSSVSFIPKAKGQLKVFVSEAEKAGCDAARQKGYSLLLMNTEYMIQGTGERYRNIP